MTATNRPLLWCIETTVQVDNPGRENEKSVSLGAGEPYETASYLVGDLYRDCVRAHGRCMGYIMADIPNSNKSKRIGWTFRRRPKPSELVRSGIKPKDASFVLDTWVEVFTEPPKRVWVPGIHAQIG